MAALFFGSAMRLGIGLALALTAALLPSSFAAADSVNIADVVAVTYPQYSMPAPTPSQVVVCHGFGCRLRAEVGLTGADRVRLAQILAGGRGSPAAERRAVAAAGAWFDRRIAAAAGTQHHRAHAGVDQMFDNDGEFDCVDASRNTTSLLLVLEELKLLHHHDVDVPVARGFLFDGVTTAHVTAVLREKKTGRKWSVDAWTRAYGQAPEIMPLAQ
jgi:hypothetical protein